jgi:hypothetical protein
MELINRKRFREHWEQIMPGLGEPGSGLWAYEDHIGIRCRWFLNMSSDRCSDADKIDFWRWCHRHLRGTVLCYSSSDSEQWWGFTHKPDVVPFVMKWG